MAESMAKVQQGPPSGGFPLVIGDNRRLGGHAALDGIFACLDVAGQQVVPLRLAPGEEIRVIDQPIFHHLGIDRKSVVEGKSVSVRVDLGGSRHIKKKTTENTQLT